MAITRVHFEGASPIKEVLDYDNLTDATEATLKHARKRYKHAWITNMWPDGVDVWACDHPDYPGFGEGFYLHVIQPE